MELWQQIIEAYPEIEPSDDFRKLGIFLKNDTDGQGDYIEKWEFIKPIPKGLKLGK